MELQTYNHLYFKLPVEIQKIIDSYYDPEYGYHYDKMKEVEKKYQLDRGGYYFPKIKLPYTFGYATKNSDNQFTFQSVKRIVSAIKVIPILFKRLKTYSKNCIGSYGGKHIVERYQKEYISNGEFIVAMILSDFKPKNNNNSINCYFTARELK
jgi:hypothetical protein